MHRRIPSRVLQSMNLDTLSLYCDVIRSGSFSLGAASHRISQSAASQAVRQLEEELGSQLIDRTKRPFMVTPEGKKFFEACVVLLENFEKAKAEITSQRTLVSGAVRVAVIYSVGLHDMGIYSQQFTRVIRTRKSVWLICTRMKSSMRLSTTKPIWGSFRFLPRIDR